MLNKIKRISPYVRQKSLKTKFPVLPPHVFPITLQTARYRRFDPTGWVGLLALFLGANVVAGNRAFIAITEETQRLEAEHMQLKARAAALDSSLLQMHERVQALFRGEAAALRGTTFERRVVVILLLLFCCLTKAFCWKNLTDHEKFVYVCQNDFEPRRRIRSVFEGIGSLEPGYDKQLGIKLVRSIVKDEGSPPLISSNAEAQPESDSTT